VLCYSFFKPPSFYFHYKILNKFYTSLSYLFFRFFSILFLTFLTENRQKDFRFFLYKWKVKLDFSRPFLFQKVLFSFRIVQKSRPAAAFLTRFSFGLI